MNEETKAAFDAQVKRDIASTFRIDTYLECMGEDIRELDFSLRCEAPDVHEAYTKVLRELEEKCLEIRADVLHELKEWKRNFPSEYEGEELE